jgi:hypothetical protein
MHREKNHQQQFFPQKKGHSRRHERSTSPFFSNWRPSKMLTSAAGKKVSIRRSVHRYWKHHEAFAARRGEIPVQDDFKLR